MKIFYSMKPCQKGMHVTEDNGDFRTNSGECDFMLKCVFIAGIAVIP